MAAKKLEEQKRLEKEKKEADLKKQKEMADLFKPVQPVQKVEKGADPKSILCAFFKQGKTISLKMTQFGDNLIVRSAVQVLVAKGIGANFLTTWKSNAKLKREVCIVMSETIKLMEIPKIGMKKS